MSNSFPAVYGYPLSVWNAMRATVVYANDQLSSLSQNKVIALAQTCADTFINANNALTAYLSGSAASKGYTLLSAAIATEGLNLSSSDTTLITDRIAALASFYSQMVTLQPTPSSNVSSSLAAGTPAISDNGLNYSELYGFSGETVPSGLSSSDFSTKAQNMATAWSDFYTAADGLNLGAATDEVYAMYAAASAVASDVSNVTVAEIDGDSTYTFAWNSLVSAPSIMEYCSTGTSDPSSAFYQQVSVIQTLAINLAYQFNLLIVNLQTAQILSSTSTSSSTTTSTSSSSNTTSNPSTSMYTVKQGDTLMSIAATQLGDYSLWKNIANLNGLLPPYISSTKSANVAIPGQQIYVSGSNTITTSSPTQTPLDYETSYLGYDVFYGPLNQDLLSWTGDYTTISGYKNLAFSLGRRLQTELGTLIYHSEFGSRIPPEIGKVLSNYTVGHIGAYATSAVLTDTRVSELVEGSLSVQALTNQGVSVSLSVLPNGQNMATGNGVTLSKVFSPSQNTGLTKPGNNAFDSSGNLLYDSSGNLLVTS